MKENINLNHPSGGSAMLKSLVIIPTYNELENLPIVLGDIFSSVPDTHVLIVDDNSPDGTGKLADHLSSSNKQVFVLHRKEKNGLGPAYLEGFRWGLDAGYPVIVEMDADGSHPASVLPGLIRAVSSSGSADLAIGSRWVNGGSVVNWPKIREFISRGGSLYARLMLNLKVKDATAGFRAFNSKVLKSINLDQVDSQGYCFQIDLTRRTQAAGFKIIEIPIEFKERELGVSKMSGSIVLEAMFQVTKWGLLRIFQKV